VSGMRQLRAGARESPASRCFRDNKIMHPRPAVPLNLPRPQLAPNAAAQGWGVRSAPKGMRLMCKVSSSTEPATAVAAATAAPGLHMSCKTMSLSRPASSSRRPGSAAQGSAAQVGEACSSSEAADGWSAPDGPWGGEPAGVYLGSKGAVLFSSEGDAAAGARGSPPARGGKSRWRPAAGAIGAARYIRTVREPKNRMRQRLSDALAHTPGLLAKAMSVPADAGGMEGTGSAQRLSRQMSVKRLVRASVGLKKWQTQGQEEAPEQEEGGTPGASSIATMQKKRSLRQARARPWADFLAGKNKNRARLKRNFSAPSTIAIDLEGLRAHIQATRQTVEEAEEYFRQQRLKKEQEALESAHAQTARTGQVRLDPGSCGKKRPPGLALLARSPGSVLRSPAGTSFVSTASPLVLQMARTRRLKMGAGSGTRSSPLCAHSPHSPYSPSMTRGGKLWGVARSRFRLHEALNHTLTPSSRRRAGLESPALSAATPGTCKSGKSAPGTGKSMRVEMPPSAEVKQRTPLEVKQRTPLEHSPHPSRRYMPGVGQVWVLTKKGKVVKVVGKTLPAHDPAYLLHTDSGALSTAHPTGCACGVAGCGGGRGGGGVGHRPQALF